ncbi:hypothetical protein JTB14_034307, partial [Gonioctena quinquepunctata]
LCFANLDDVNVMHCISPLVKEDSHHPALKINSKILDIVLAGKISHQSKLFRKDNYDIINEKIGSIDWNFLLNNPNVDVMVNAIKFEKEKVFIIKNKRKVFEGHKKENGLYKVNLDNTLESFFTEKEEHADLWDQKLGHLGIKNIERLLDLSTGINMI